MRGTPERNITYINDYLEKSPRFGACEEEEDTDDVVIVKIPEHHDTHSR